MYVCMWVFDWVCVYPSQNDLKLGTEAVLDMCPSLLISGSTGQGQGYGYGQGVGVYLQRVHIPSS